MRINPENKSVDMEQRDINYILPPYIRNYLFMNKNEMPDKIIFPMFPAVNVLGADGKMHLIPIDYIAPDSEVAAEIAQDGTAVPEVTPAQEAVLDEKDEEIKRLKAEVESLTPTGWGEEDEAGDTPVSEPEASSEESTVTLAPEDLIRQQQENVQQAADEAADKILEIETQPEPEVSPAKAAFADTPTPEQRMPKQPPGGDIGPGQSLSGMGPRDAGDLLRTAKALQPEPDINETEEKPFEKEIKRDEAGKPIVEDKPDVAD